MSSRALRKLQREQEQQAQLAKLQEDKAISEEDGEDAEAEAEAVSKVIRKKNAFDMLNAAEESDDENEEPSEIVLHKASDQLEAVRPLGQAEDGVKRKKNKKSKKKKQASKVETPVSQTEAPKIGQKSAVLDEIDIALLSLKNKSPETKDVGGSSSKPSQDMQQLFGLLSIDTKNLNALNEMKRLFGKVVLDGENPEDGAAGPARRRGRGPQQLDLNGALAGRNSPISRGQGLAGLALRRNVFMLGKEEWPKAASGGLAMELVEKAWDHTTEYRFVHSTQYQDVQHQFGSCVESLDPQRMIQLLLYNPYHISTILQVSEIAKQQGDHSVSGDLLERALFSFGRSVHSSFHSALAEGKARLDFRRPENREFWLAAWRYIGNLGQRGTWRTAYEWAKLMFSLDPEQDPYCVRLVLDQLAIRGGQFEHFIDLVQTYSSIFGESAFPVPNFWISVGLAQYKLKQAAESRASLTNAVQKFPWVIARLFQELNLDHIPPSIWGKEPRTELEKLECESYVIRAKDIWNTPEAISFLVEVAESVYEAKPDPPSEDDSITMDHARHIILSDIPSLISLIPRRFTNARTSSSDPLPPSENLTSYFPADRDSIEDDLPNPNFAERLRNLIPAEEPPSANQQPVTEDEVTELRGLQAFFTRLIPWLSPSSPAPSATPSAPNPSDEPSLAELQRSIEESGIPPETLNERGRRMVELQERLLAQNQSHRTALPSGGDTAAWSTDNPLGQRRQNAIMQAVLEGELDESLLETDNPLMADLLQRPPAADSIFAPYLDEELMEEEEEEEGDEAPMPGLMPVEEEEQLYDDERNQRWLAGQGMLQVKEFVEEHGADERVWEGVDPGAVEEYARRAVMLQRRATRNFVLDYVLQQGAGSEARALVLRFIDRLGEA